MSQIQYDDFSKLEFKGWERVANQYIEVWAKLTQLLIDPLCSRKKINWNLHSL